MKSNRKTHVIIHFPATGEIYQEDLNFEETISQLIGRILQKTNVTYSDNFKLYSIDKKCQRFKPEESCSALFGLSSKELILTRSELITVDLFFENHRYFIVYDTSTSALNFLYQSLHLLNSSSTKYRPPLSKSDIANYYFVLYDPIADVVIKSHSTLNTTFVVLKRFEYIAPGYVFNFSLSKDFYGKISNCSFESIVTSNFIKHIRSYHRNEHFSGINFKEFSEEKSQFLFESFCTKMFDKSEVTLSDQINFLFTVLSLAKQPYIPYSLRKMIIRTMKIEDDRKRFECARAIALYIPLSTHLVLEELFQLFGTATIDEESWMVVTQMLAELLFESKTEDIEENYTEELEDQNKYPFDTFLRFTRFMFLYFKQIFRLTENIGRKNSIRMIKKPPKADAKSPSKRAKSERKSKGDKKSEKKKEDDEDEIDQSNDDSQTDNIDFDEIKKSSKASKRSKSDRKKKSEEKSEEDAIRKEPSGSIESLNDDDESQEIQLDDSVDRELDEPADADNDAYEFVLYEEMKIREMVIRNIDGFLNINVEDTVEFVPNDSLFDVLCGLAQNKDEEIKVQDIDEELNELNDMISKLKVKLNASELINQTAGPVSKERKTPSLIC